jgi:polyketide synthase 12/candicidin polyketide synthase FscB
MIGMSAVRAHVRLDEDTATIQLVDEHGAHVASIGALRLLPISSQQIRRAVLPQDGSLELAWRQISPPAPNTTALASIGNLKVPGARHYASIGALHAAIADGDPAPAVVLLDQAGTPGDVAEAALAATTVSLALIQDWLGDDRLAETRLALLTRRAVVATEGEAPDLAAAPLWGLLRSAQTEHPDRFSLVDIDDTDESLQVLASALGQEEEPQIALRMGNMLAPRLVRRPPATGPTRPTSIDPESTVLITGGTGGLGAILARHLASAHGVRHLLLVSRSGPNAEQADSLGGELRELGATPTLAACDVADRDQLARLLDSISPKHPLSSVIHAAGTLADGVVSSLQPDQLRRVFASKVDAAWNLHELTADRELSAFILFSSVAGTLGSPGQANYAAANVFLDALAAYRTAHGLTAISIAWGLWAAESAMTDALNDADLARVRRSGIGTLSNEQGLAHFDTASAAERSLVLAVPLDPSALRAQATAGVLPTVMRDLVRMPPRRDAGASLLTRLNGAAEDERPAMVLQLVRGEVAAVLGHGDAGSIDPAKAFRDLGFDSLAAVELRNRLGAATALRLPATVVFDYPTALTLADRLLEQLAPRTTTSTDAAIDEIESMLASITVEAADRSRVAARLRTLVASFDGLPGFDERTHTAETLRSASTGELKRFIDEQLGPDSTTRPVSG